MSLKETNRVKTIGVLPTQNAEPIPVGKIPDDATQVLAHDSKTNGTKVVYTVTAGKTLYINSIAFTGYNISGATEYVALHWYNDSAAYQGSLFYPSLPDGHGVNVTMSFPCPWEMTAGWYFSVYASAANVQARAVIHGYEM